MNAHAKQLERERAKQAQQTASRAAIEGVTAFLDAIEEMVHKDDNFSPASYRYLMDLRASLARDLAELTRTKAR